jgi:hypothetical protein
MAGSVVRMAMVVALLIVACVSAPAVDSITWWFVAQRVDGEWVHADQCVVEGVGHPSERHGYLFWSDKADARVQVRTARDLNPGERFRLDKNDVPLL